MGTPTLVVVSGPAGTGKTTLAHLLAPMIGCPVVSRDEIKEGMVHAHPGYAPTPSDELTRRTYDVFFATIGLLLRNGVSLVAEAAFQDRLWRPKLEPMLEFADIRVIQCEVALDVARERQLRRLDQTATRAAHADHHQLRQSGAAASFVPLSLDVATLRVDTTDGYQPDLAAIAAFGSAPGTIRSPPDANRP